jgi:alpha-amylase
MGILGEWEVAIVDRTSPDVKISLLLTFMQNKDSKIFFVFGLHNHQPVGNLSSVFEKAFTSCYLPFLSTLEKFPNLKAVIHNSGALYSFAEAYFPGWIEKLKKLTKRGQIEIIGGGYFEPIFPIISQQDQIGQIQLMKKYLEKTFGVTPQGCWVPERVWNPSLAKTLNELGVSYTYLDEADFYAKNKANKSKKNLYLSEDQGYPINLFVIDELLADKIPFIQPEEVIDILINYKKDNNLLINFFCDGEKFGLWPGSYDLVYNQKWLERFFTLLERNPDIQTITSRQANDMFDRKDLVYVESTTYPKMQKWALNYKDCLNYQSLIDLLKENKSYPRYRQFIKGETFKNFFIKYPRLNFMHKRMLDLSKRINLNLDYEKDREAFLNLWKSQANCVYWHGVFGGFYLPHLRKACYDYLIKAEECLDRITKTDSFYRKDINFDGYKEIVVESSRKIYIFSQVGASLEELSLKDIPINLINTVNRVKEPYHDKFKGREMSKYLLYDDYKKVSLVDHIIKKDLSLTDFAKGTGIYSLADKPYRFFQHGDKNFSFGYKEKEISFLKEISFGENRVEAEYNFIEKKAFNKFDFGIEFNFSLSSPGNLFIEAGEERKENLGKEQDLGENSSFTIVDKNYPVRLRFDFDRVRVYTNPIYTLSSSEAGEEVLFQQLSLLFYFRPKKDSFKLNLSIES